MNIGTKGLDLIRFFEGLELNAYQCAAGVWTIGYGHTKDVQQGMTISEARANEMLAEELNEYESYINGLVTVELNQDQFDAMVSWVYNLGVGNLKASTLLKVLNAGDYDGVPAQMMRWNKAGGKVLEGLTKRRQAEADQISQEMWDAMNKHAMERDMTIDEYIAEAFTLYKEQNARH